MAEHKGYDEPFAYVWLSAKVFGVQREPEGLTADQCDKLIAYRLEAS